MIGISLFWFKVCCSTTFPRRHPYQEEKKQNLATATSPNKAPESPKEKKLFMVIMLFCWCFVRGVPYIFFPVLGWWAEMLKDLNDTFTCPCLHLGTPFGSLTNNSWSFLHFLGEPPGRALRGAGGETKSNPWKVLHSLTSSREQKGVGDDVYQVIPFVTQLDSRVGGHQQPFKKDT